MTTPADCAIVKWRDYAARVLIVIFAGFLALVLIDEVNIVVRCDRETEVCQVEQNQVFTRHPTLSFRISDLRRGRAYVAARTKKNVYYGLEFTTSDGRLRTIELGSWARVEPILVSLDQFLRSPEQPSLYLEDGSFWRGLLATMVLAIIWAVFQWLVPVVVVRVWKQRDSVLIERRSFGPLLVRKREVKRSDVERVVVQSPFRVLTGTRVAFIMRDGTAIPISGGYTNGWGFGKFAGALRRAMNLPDDS